MGRTDDIINVAGHRLSTGGMEEVLAEHPDVAECVVVGVRNELKGEIPVGLLVLNAGVTRDHAEIVREVVQMVRDRIGPVAAFKTAAVVARLPKTRSGKMLRSTIKCIADNTPYRMPATIDDPEVLTQMPRASDCPSRFRRTTAVGFTVSPRSAGPRFASGDTFSNRRVIWPLRTTPGGPWSGCAGEGEE